MSFEPSDSQLADAVREQREARPESSAKFLQRVIKIKYPDWALSETRLKKFIKSNPATEQRVRSQAHTPPRAPENRGDRPSQVPALSLPAPPAAGFAVMEELIVSSERQRRLDNDRQQEFLQQFLQAQ